MNNLISNENIEKLIYEIRGIQVMLDSDLADLYECVNGTKTINQAVNRHLDRFPSDFYFQLTKTEFGNLQSQIGTANLNTMTRTLPYVFTEQGVAMLATVLRTKVASQMSISIMRAFVSMRHYISSNLIEQKYINNMVIEHDDKIKILQKSFSATRRTIYSAPNGFIFNGINTEMIIANTTNGITAELREKYPESEGYTITEDGNKIIITHPVIENIEYLIPKVLI